MSNANSSTMTASFHAAEILLTRIDVYCHDDGSYHACALHGEWRGDGENITSVGTFTRGNHRVKVVIHNRKVSDADSFGAWLCRTLIDKDERVWRTVQLNER